MCRPVKSRVFPCDCIPQVTVWIQVYSDRSEDFKEFYCIELCESSENHHVYVWRQRALSHGATTTTWSSISATLISYVFKCLAFKVLIETQRSYECLDCVLEIWSRKITRKVFFFRRTLRGHSEADLRFFGYQKSALHYFILFKYLCWISGIISTRVL